MKEVQRRGEQEKEKDQMDTFEALDQGGGYMFEVSYNNNTFVKLTRESLHTRCLLQSTTCLNNSSF